MEDGEMVENAYEMAIPVKNTRKYECFFSRFCEMSFFQSKKILNRCKMILRPSRVRI